MNIYHKFLIAEVIALSKGEDVKRHFKEFPSQQPCSKCFVPINFGTIKEYGDGLCCNCWGKTYCTIVKEKGESYLINKSDNTIMLK